MEAIFRFFRLSLMSFKALFSFLNPLSYVLFKIINPIMQLTFYCLLAKYVYNTQDVTPWVIGNAILLCTFNAFFGIGTVLQEERSFGTLSIVMVTPASKFGVFLARAFMHIFDALLTTLFGLIVGAILFKVDFSGVNLLLFLLTIIVAMFASASMGLVVSSFGLISRDVNFVLNLASMMCLALSGANFPISNLPIIFQKVAYLIPITRSVQAARLIVAKADIQLIYSLIFQEFIVGIIYIVVGYWILKIVEIVARKAATFDAY